MALPYSRIARARTSADIEKVVTAVCTQFGLDGSLPLADLIDDAAANGHTELAEFFEKAENRLSEVDQ